MEAQSKKNNEPAALALFGGDEGWCCSDWTASDDRVRGGKSQSYLKCGEETARFYGTLDIKTLGGAGFASQRTTDDDRDWDLSDYAGIQIKIKEGDKKRYTFILKDELLPPDPETDREQSTISWECDFELPPQDEPGKAHDESIFIPWDSFNPTYRGKPKKDADHLDLKKIKRFSFMMRSFFGTQEGDFSLCIESVSALCKAPPPTSLRFASSDKSFDMRQLEDGTAGAEQDRSYYTFHVNSPLSSGDVRLHRSTTQTFVTLLGFLAVYYLGRRYIWR